MSIKQVKFRGRHVLRRAVLFLVTGIISLCVLIVLPILISFGILTDYSGIIGVAAALVALVGFIVEANAAGVKDVYPTQPYAGMVINGLTFVAFVVIYVIGLL